MALRISRTVSGADRNSCALESAECCLGLLLIALPEMYGVGYPVLERAVDGRYIAGFLLIGKTLATSLTMAIGGSGGVFAPSLFMARCSVRRTAKRSMPCCRTRPHPRAPTGLPEWAPCSRRARAPITAVLIIYELTGEYSTILPLMLAIVLATAISARLSRDTIYTLKLRRRGIKVGSASAPLLADVLVRDAMSTTPDPFLGDTPLQDVVERFATSTGTALPVIDDQRRLLGVISATDLESAIQDHRPTAINATSLAHTPHSSMRMTLSTMRSRRSGVLTRTASRS
jgi:chloride channel protein, CIC family